MGCFIIAYALGLLVAGRFVDKVGTRIGYMVIMALWSLSAMGHALVNSVLQLGIARSCLGIGESGNFPAANKTNAEWFPQKERSLVFRHLQLRRQCRRDSGHTPRAHRSPIIRLARRLSDYRIFLGLVDTAVVPQIPQARRTSHALRRRTCLHQPGRLRRSPAPSTPWIKLLGLRQTWAYSIPKFLTDPIWWFYLYWLPGYFSDRFHLSLVGLGLPILIVYNASAIGSIYGGYLPAPFIRMGLSAERARLAAMLLCASPRCSRLSH